MFGRLREYVVSKLKIRTFGNDDEIYLHLLSNVATIFCLLVHIYLFTFFTVVKSPLFSLANVVSICIYLLLSYFVKKRKYTVVGLGISLEVSIYTLFSSCFLALDSYVIGYYLLVIVMQVIVPYGTNRMRAWVTAAIIALSTGSVFLDLFAVPSLALPGAASKALAISNIYLVILGVLFELFINNFAKEVIRNLNSDRINVLQEQAFTDSLTGLYNRRYADRVFNQLVEKGGSHCVAILDIDDFKKVNDTLGHACGDEVLQYLADFLCSELRKLDTVFRWGGEEFLILLDEVDIDTAFWTLDRARRKLSLSDIATGKGNVRITVTVGVAKFDPQDIEGSIERCDKNLYIGKSGNKNVVVA